MGIHIMNGNAAKAEIEKTKGDVQKSAGKNTVEITKSNNITKVFEAGFKVVEALVSMWIDKKSPK